MNHKNPVSGTGDGVLHLDIMKKHEICFDCRFGKKSVTGTPAIMGLILKRITYSQRINNII
jgi:hypothetical protein